MDPLRVYSIPIRGLEDGHHQYQFELDASFFKLYENSPVQSGMFEVVVSLDKHSYLSTLDLRISGHFVSTCDRCLVEIDIPISGKYQLVIKDGEGPSDDPDLVFLPLDAYELKMADILYDYTCLSLPIVRVIDCDRMENRPCDVNVLKYIQKEEKNQQGPGPWDELKNLNVN